MTRWSTILMTAVLIHAAGCGPIKPEEEAWFGRVKAGELMPVPFSHDLEVLGFQGWRYLGRLTEEASQADAIRFRLWFESEYAPGAAVASAAEGQWEVPNGPQGDRVSIDLLLKRDVIDGEPTVSYRALLNGRYAYGRLPIPPGYRQSISVVPAEDSRRLQLEEPISLGTVTLETWVARAGGHVRYFMRNQEYRWFIEFTAESGEPLP